MRSSYLKTKHVAAISVQQFLWRHPCSYYWTFTMGDGCPDKAIAMERAKPLFDLIGRRKGLCDYPSRSKGFRRVMEKGEYLAFWELQERGAWHLHLLCSVRLDVNWLRPWMKARGWGPQMRVELVSVQHRFEGDGRHQGVANVGNGGVKLARYLTKYLTKGCREGVPKGKKCFTASAAAKCGTVGFCWDPMTNPAAYLFYYGRILFLELYGRVPRFSEFPFVMRLGWEACDWSSVDPWSDPPG